MLKYEGIVLRGFKFTKFLAKFGYYDIQVQFFDKKRNYALKNDQCRPKIGMVVVINVLNKNIKCLSSFHAFYPCSNAQTLLPSQLMSFLTDF